MKKIVTAFFILISTAVYSQGLLSSKNIHIDISGFVRNDFILDSRENVAACDYLLEFFPQKPDYDFNGKDINAQPSAHFLNIFSRMGTRFSGLEMNNINISAYLEVDFTGSSATNGLRLRHAYTLFTWPKTSLLFGRTWHPLFIEKVYPSVLNENTGLPFQVFNRSPQLRLTHQLSENMNFIAGAIYQYNYANSGPNGKDYKYQRNTVIPNLHAQIQYYNETWVMGAAIDWKSIQPRTFSTAMVNSELRKFKTGEKLNTWAALVYLKYSKNKFQLKAKSMYGQNACESLLPGGYAVASVNPDTGRETYTPLNHTYNWINVVYGNNWKLGFFAGYLKNMGTNETPVGPFYGLATDVDQMYKFSPQLIYTYKNFMFGWEVSATTAAYGQINLEDKGRVIITENVTNYRNLISVAYNF